MKLVISVAHQGVKAAVSKVMRATWRRCRVHFMRNVSAYAGKSARRVVTAGLRRPSGDERRLRQETADAANGP